MSFWWKVDSIFTPLSSPVVAQIMSRNKVGMIILPIVGTPVNDNESV